MKTKPCKRKKQEKKKLKRLNKNQLKMKKRKQEKKDIEIASKVKRKLLMNGMDYSIFQMDHWNLLMVEEFMELIY